jgi:hypothetical protein
MKSIAPSVLRSNHVRRVRTSVCTVALAVLGTLVISACQSSDAVLPNTTAVAGSYSLITVNDSALPRTVLSSTNYLLQIVNDTIQLSTFGTWADLTNYVETSGTTIDYPYNLIFGTFTVSGATINFTTSNGDKFAGTVDGNSLQIVGTARALYVK